MHTNTTTNYDLPQFVGTDKPSWLGDVNGAMSAIDTAIHAREVEAGTAQASADTANAKADTLDTRMGTAETNITALQNASTTDHAQIATNTSNISQNAQDIVQLDTKIGHTQITIGDHTVTGAIAELASEVGEPVDAEDVSYDNTQSGLTATNVQDAIDEVKGDIPSTYGAGDIVYDNTTSGLSATDVQGAIDELAGGVAGWTVIDHLSVTGTSGTSNTKAITADLSRYKEILLICASDYVSDTNFIVHESTVLPININGRSSRVYCNSSGSLTKFSRVTLDYSNGTVTLGEEILFASASDTETAVLCAR